MVHFGDKLLHVIPQRFDVGRELEDLIPGARVSSFGRNIMLFVEGGRLEIWCAEISLKRLRRHVRTNIEWSSAVKTVDPFVDHYKVLYTVSN